MGNGGRSQLLGFVVRFGGSPIPLIGFNHSPRVIEDVTGAKQKAKKQNVKIAG